MKMENIAELLESVMVTSLNLKFELRKQDLISILAQFIQEQLPKIEKLPDGITLELLELKDLGLHEKTISAKAIFRVLSGKIYMPDSSDLQLDLNLPLMLIEKRLQVGIPALEIEAIDKTWKQKLVQKIVNKLIDWNDQKITAILDNKVNPMLKNPSSWTSVFEKLTKKDLPFTADYLIDDLQGESVDKMLHLQTKLNLSVNKNLPIIDNSKALQLVVKKQQLFEMLLAQINKDIKAKIEQDVELISIDIPQTNTLLAKGRVAVMNITKEFDLTAAIRFDPASSKVNLLVADIAIDGGFLVQRGFALIEPTIKKKIEQAVDINLEKTLLGIKLPLPVPSAYSKYEGSFSNLDLLSLDIVPQQDLLQFDIAYAELQFDMKVVEET